MLEFLMPTWEKRPLIIISYYSTTEQLSISYCSTILLDNESFHGNGLADSIIT
jgi:hypothetical protein